LNAATALKVTSANFANPALWDSVTSPPTVVRLPTASLATATDTTIFVTPKAAAAFASTTRLATTASDAPGDFTATLFKAHPFPLHKYLKIGLLLP
jgi:hypothetical protein